MPTPTLLEKCVWALTDGGYKAPLSNIGTVQRATAFMKMICKLTLKFDTVKTVPVIGVFDEDARATTIKLAEILKHKSDGDHLDADEVHTIEAFAKYMRFVPPPEVRNTPQHTPMQQTRMLSTRECIQTCTESGHDVGVQDTERHHVVLLVQHRALRLRGRVHRQRLRTHSVQYDQVGCTREEGRHVRGHERLLHAPQPAQRTLREFRSRQHVGP